jgi:hypothetical protein
VAHTHLVIFMAIILFNSIAIAEQPTKAGVNDSIARELNKSKSSYQSSVVMENEKLLAAFTVQQKKLDGNTKLKVEQQIKLIQQIQDERKAFEADSTNLPKSATMMVAVSDYRTRIAIVHKKCEAAFDKAAQAYRRNKDLVAAKAVLEEKIAFLRIFTDGKFEIVCDPAVGPASVEFVADGTGVAFMASFDWLQKFDIVKLTFREKSLGSATLQIKSCDVLVGENVHANGRTWKWTLTRVKK